MFRARRKDFCEARIEVDESRLKALDPGIDIEATRAHLASIPAICTGGSQGGTIGKLSRRERFDWLVAPRSTIIQTSKVHTGRCTDPGHPAGAPAQHDGAAASVADELKFNFDIQLRQLARAGTAERERCIGGGGQLDEQ